MAGLGGFIGKVLGSVAGAVVGGPTGAAVGGSIGGSIGGSLGDEEETTPTRTGLLAKPKNQFFKTDYQVKAPSYDTGSGGGGNRETIKNANPALKSEDIVSRESYFWASFFDSAMTDSKKITKTSGE